VSDEVASPCTNPHQGFGLQDLAPARSLAAARCEVPRETQGKGVAKRSEGEGAGGARAPAEDTLNSLILMADQIPQPEPHGAGQDLLDAGLADGGRRRAAADLFRKDRRTSALRKTITQMVPTQGSTQPADTADDIWAKLVDRLS
jgi:hypothetical protein